MKVTIDPGSISGCIQAAPSKSMTQRVYAAALLHKGITTIHGAGFSDDEQAALSVVQQLGAKIVSQEAGTTVIESAGLVPVSTEINCGESGLSARLFIPIAALSDKEITITGQGSLMQRPMKQFTHLLPLLDVQVYGTTNQLPLKLRGPLVAKNITIDGSDSSQFLSGLLFAYCYAASDSEKVIEVENLSSRPYVDMTIDVLRKFGNGVSHENYHTFRIDPSGTIKPDDLEITIDGDWSSAAFWLVAGAIAGDVEIAGLVNNSLQADQAIYGLLHSIGARIEWLDGKLKVSKSRMKAFEFDATDCPDLFPVLAILAALCTGESYIKGVHRLFHKESNRAESISEMLENFNVPYSIEDDSFCISGVNTLQGTIIDSHKDHRIVMAAAIGALRANGPVDIEGVEAVNKSYPGFFKDLENVRSARW